MLFFHRNSDQSCRSANLFSLLALGFVFQSLVACGGSSGPSFNNNGNVPVYTYPNEEASQEALRNWKVRCSDSSNCPDTVGQLVMQVGESVGVCTGTLIAPDRILTNSHCFDMPDAGLTHATLCSQGTRIVFAENSRSGREVVECESVVVKSRIRNSGEQKFLDPDYMILKLKRSVSRGFESINFSGLEDGMRLEVRKVNPNRPGGGTLDVARCEVLHQTALLPSANSALAPVHILAGCPVIPGNSGSSVFDSQGQIRGVLFAGVQRELLDQARLPRAVVSRLKELMPSYAANAACISTLGRESLPSRCSQGRTSAENRDEDRSDFNQLDIRNRLERDLQSFSGNPRFGYDFRRKVNARGESEMVYRPVCLRASAASSFGEVMQANLMIWSEDLQLDERLKPRVEFRPRSISCQFEYEGPSGHGVRIETLSSDCRLGSSASSRETWPICLP
ncbi:MAG: trypsin-like serine peptidase [Bdellovibrionales bacterium]